MAVTFGRVAGFGCLGLLLIPATCMVVVSLIPRPKPSTTVSPDSASTATATPNAAPATPSQAPITRWRGGHQGRDAMDDTETVSFEITSEDRVQNWLSQRQQPTLEIRCKAKKTEVIVDATTATQPVYRENNRARVRIRFDDGPVESKLWSEGTNSQYLFATNAVSTLRRMLRAKRVRFAVTPLNMGEQSFEFDLTGLDAVAAEVAKTCGWKL